MSTFSSLSVAPELVTALAKRGITTPTPVQERVLPRVMAGDNILFQSETGTGKTLCYLLPAFMRCEPGAKTPPKVLIIAPTHELASQIRREASTLSADSGLEVRSTLFIGGAPLKRQVEALKEKPAIVIGGPARVVELVRLKKLDLRSLSLVALDEADRMLAPELRDALAELLTLVPADAVVAACSATVTAHHAKLLSSMLARRQGGSAESARFDTVTLPPEDVLKRNISHWAFYSEGRDKTENLRRFIVAEKPSKLLAFTSIVGQVDGIAARLKFRGVSCAALHAKLDKIGRKKALDDFRAGRIAVLVTSDLSARGLDIADVSHVVQLDVSDNEDFFVHRAGRTARAGKSGINAVFGDEVELRRLARIEKRLGIVVYPKVLHGGVVRSPEAETDGDEGDDPGRDQ